MIITIASLKGGCGKTSMAVNLALSMSGRGKVLVCDFDPQSSMTDYFLRTEQPEIITERNAWHLLTERKEAKDCIFPGLFLDCLPAVPKLHTAGFEMAGDPGVLLRLKNEIKKLKYSAVIIDTPPSMSFEFRAGLYCADVILSPVMLDRWSMQGLALLQSEIGKAEKTTRKKVSLKIVPSIVTPKEAEKMRNGHGSIFTKSEINKASGIRRAIAQGKRLKNESKSALQYEALAKEIAGEV